MTAEKNNQPMPKFYITGLSILAVLLVGGLGFLGYQINSALNREIHGTPRGEVGEKTPSDLGIEYKPVEFTSSNTTKDKLSISGWFIDGSSNDCVVLAPGKGQTRWKLFDYIPFLHKAGYDLLMFDPQGRGKSEGEKWAFGYYESRDIINGVQYLEENHKPDKIGILGRSAGATAALIAALENEKISAVVADSPFASIKLASESYGGYENNPLFDLLFPLYGLGANQMLNTDVVQKTDLTERISSLETPVLFIHGNEDEVLFPKNSRVLYKNKPGKKVLWTPENVGHVEGFEEQPEEYKKRILGFFHAQL